MRKPLWEIKQAAEGVLQLYIYGDVEGEEFDWENWRYVQSDNSAEHFREELAKHPDVSRIEIYINSYGGSVFEGTAIYNQLKRHPARKVVHVDGFACSIASVIAMAGDEVIMPRNTLMMIHNTWMCACGNAAELRKAADDLDVINTAGRHAYLQKAGDKLTLSVYRISEDKTINLTITLTDAHDLEGDDPAETQQQNQSQNDNSGNYGNGYGSFGGFSSPFSSFGW